MQRRELPDGWDARPARRSRRTRRASPRAIASGQALNAIAAERALAGRRRGRPHRLDRDVGLTFEGAGDFSAEDRGGRYLHFGVREHGMRRASTASSLSKLRPYGATYLIFSDYAREPIRLSALMEIPAIWIFTHDSIGLGEDGPTHQPVEQLASLRAMPGLVTIRPCDANEAVEAWRVLMTAAPLSRPRSC